MLGQWQSALDTFVSCHTAESNKGSFPTFNPVFLALVKVLHPALGCRVAREYVQRFDNPTHIQALRAAGLVSLHALKKARMTQRIRSCCRTNKVDVHIVQSHNIAFIIMDDMVPHDQQHGAPGWSSHAAILSEEWVSM